MSVLMLPLWNSSLLATFNLLSCFFTFFSSTSSSAIFPSFFLFLNDSQTQFLKCPWTRGALLVLFQIFYSFLLCSLLLVLSWIVHHPNSKFCGNSLPCWCRRSIFFSSVRLWVTLEIGAWNSTRDLIKHHYNLFSHIYNRSYIYFNLLSATYRKRWITTTMSLAKTKCLLLWDHTQKGGQIKWYGGSTQGKCF